MAAHLSSYAPYCLQHRLKHCVFRRTDDALYGQSLFATFVKSIVPEVSHSACSSPKPEAAEPTQQAAVRQAAQQQPQPIASSALDSQACGTAEADNTAYLKTDIPPPEVSGPSVPLSSSATAMTRVKDEDADFPEARPLDDSEMEETRPQELGHPTVNSHSAMQLGPAPIPATCEKGVGGDTPAQEVNVQQQIQETLHVADHIQHASDLLHAARGVAQPIDIDRISEEVYALKQAVELLMMMGPPKEITARSSQDHTLVRRTSSVSRHATTAPHKTLTVRVVHDEEPAVQPYKKHRHTNSMRRSGDPQVHQPTGSSLRHSGSMRNYNSPSAGRDTLSTKGSSEGKPAVTPPRKDSSSIIEEIPVCDSLDFT